MIKNFNDNMNVILMTIVKNIFVEYVNSIVKEFHIKSRLFMNELRIKLNALQKIFDFDNNQNVRDCVIDYSTKESFCIIDKKQTLTL